MDISYKQKFYDIYINKVFPKLGDLETKRLDFSEKVQKAKNLYSKLVVVAIMLFFLSMYFVIFSDKYYFYLIMGVSLFASVIFYVNVKLTKEHNESLFKNLLKTNFIPIFVHAIPNLRYLSGNAIIPSKQADFYKRSKLFGYFDYIEADDIFEGKYSDTPFQIQELKFLRYDSNDNSNEVFSCLAILVNSNKEIKSQTIIKQITKKIDKGIISNFVDYLPFLIVMICFLFASYILNVLNDVLIFMFMFFFIPIFLVVMSKVDSKVNIIFNKYSKGWDSKDESLKLLQLENQDFNRKFNVYSQDEVEARYLVTTVFMDRLMNLQTAFGTKNIKCSFFEDNILFAIETNKDLFEIGNLHESLRDSKQVREFFEQIISIYKMIDYFKLAQKTGL